ncbi:S8 family peptidase [Polycladomyces subterraneus]|uniref:S8 family peptidase n=1 Tax=Polycladomyces subterraneus TaxID=1016997 RepID=A0ABT8ISD3_9BACL|nr:S8 family peptidase [Polycladomyces subterraneus]MDN4595292.1 S8 family peptidase [Polycladomyces subterraneus]
MMEDRRYTFLFRTSPKPEKIRQWGGKVYHVSRYSRSVSAVVPSAKALKALLRDHDLILAEQDRLVGLPSPQLEQIYRVRSFQEKSRRQVLPWNIQRVWNAKPVSNAGKGVRVGVIDTGIDLTHPDLRGNIKGGVNLIKPSASPQDDNGHGTHVAGIIAAINNRIGVVGVAPAAQLYAIKVLNSRGVGTLSTLIKGIEWAIDHGMHIVNISIGGGTSVPGNLVAAINAAVNRGILVVAAAGNNGQANGKGNNVEVPAKIPGAVAVAALAKNNHRAPFSATGPEVDIAAPGVRILSTFKGGRYAVLSGTSQAAPHVAGAAAVFKQLNPGLPLTVLKQILFRRARQTGSPRLTGAGLLQIR